MRPILVLVSILMFSPHLLAKSNFDPLQCNGKTFEIGADLDTVLKYCGDPINITDWDSAYASCHQYLLFKAQGRAGCYRTDFFNHKMIDSHYLGHVGYTCRVRFHGLHF